MTEEPANAAERESDGYAQAYPVIAKLRAEVYRLESVNAELLAALEQSVKLQSHYADLLNMYDGGQRMQFASADAWRAKTGQTRRPEKEGRVMAHTPGPWSIQPARGTGGAFEVGSETSRVAIIRDVRRFGATGDIDPSTEGLPGANARLIAAAPDLLAALKEILPWHDSHPAEATDNRVINQCRAAIAKVDAP